MHNTPRFTLIKFHLVPDYTAGRNSDESREKTTMATVINSTGTLVRINDVHVVFIENEPFVALKKEIE